MTNDSTQHSLKKQVKKNSNKTPSISAILFIKQFARVYITDNKSIFSAYIAN